MKDKLPPQDASLLYARAYLTSYEDALHNHYPSILSLLPTTPGLLQHISLHGRILGEDVYIAVFISDLEFYLAFLNRRNEEVSDFVDERGNKLFDDEWTRTTPDNKRENQIVSALKIDPNEIIDTVRIPGASDFLSKESGDLERQGKGHGYGKANQSGDEAKANMLRHRLEAMHSKAKKKRREDYEKLTKQSDNPQQRGIDFEALMREALDDAGWQTKKIALSGEESDFTAIVDGNHILGEIKWLKEEITGGLMREMIAKLDPRPQTIGLYISVSGFDDGAISTIKRSRNTKTIVLFDKEDIDKVLLYDESPTDLLSKKLRDTYDYIFEITKDA